MKRRIFLLTLVAGLFLTLSASAQTPAPDSAKVPMDFYVGNWKVLMKETPQGDVKLLFKVEKKGEELAGVVQDTTGKEITVISKIEYASDEVTIYFSAAGYDLSLTLAKKDEDHVTGSLMAMFQAEGERVKEVK
ncbi:MAG: hypothetical protein B7Y15_11905 [Bacteroidetes bacterium 24-39-8]|nr:MAG: hypothetical protein B7Y69_00330 [Sphingobacteriia bacterium 35-40-8]OYZ48538.1 MAG: hypothetical protein B7Y15_11905 [Bacteroidetes bacterium 24-39-8]OZA67810.1 MAG: hypothetical protein B7X72_03015 [Sphingobacteriia bacterium 39-39-8]HQR92167.1 hypothetical protein [Sediminibacterium sp.]HQS56189.1 hypothetical protein [Sediminibacterium sp.]